MERHTSLALPRGRPRSFDIDVAVERAMNVFWSTGYHGTSLPDLLEATSLSRGSLYAAFGDKHGLFLRALNRYIEDALARLGAELNSSKGALAGVRKCLAGYVDRASAANGKRGCLVVATAMELSARCRSQFSNWEILSNVRGATYRDVDTRAGSGRIGRRRRTGECRALAGLFG